MDTKKLLDELGRVYNKELGKFVGTGETNIVCMLDDVIPKIQLLSELEDIRGRKSPKVVSLDIIDEYDLDWSEVKAVCGRDSCKNIVGTYESGRWLKKNFCDSCGCEVDWEGID